MASVLVTVCNTLEWGSRNLDDLSPGELDRLRQAAENFVADCRAQHEYTVSVPSDKWRSDSLKAKLNAPQI